MTAGAADGFVNAGAADGSVTVAVPKLPFSVPFWNKNCGFWNRIHIINLKSKNK